MDITIVYSDRYRGKRHSIRLLCCCCCCIHQNNNSGRATSNNLPLYGKRREKKSEFIFYDGRWSALPDGLDDYTTALAVSSRENDTLCLFTITMDNVREAPHIYIYIRRKKQERGETRSGTVKGVRKSFGIQSAVM